LLPSPTWVPEACTLPTVDQPLRLAEFDELFGTAVLGVRRIEAARLHLDLRPEPAIAARAAELAARETGCCSFFTFSLIIGSGTLTLDVQTPAAQIDVLDALGARAAAAMAGGTP
jgi:hypothetical protein